MIVKAKQLTPELLVPLIGDYLVDRGFITNSDLKMALTYQQDHSSPHHNQLLGQILVDMGKIDRSILDFAVFEQIKNWKDALEQTNRQLEERVKERTAELEKALNKINELNQLKANFIANISHELRTPLTHLKGYLDLMSSGDLGNLESEQKQVLGVMNRATDRLERLIEDLILFTFADHDEVIIINEKFDLSAITKSIIKNMRAAFPNRRISFFQQPDNSQIWVFADQKKISWVINHLIENAGKFSEPESEIIVRINSNSETVNVSIIDHGIGIHQDKLQEIFEPFHQLDGSSTRRYGGVGLGLALSKKIVEAHNSSLRVNSEIGVGSKFEFNLKRLIK